MFRNYIRTAWRNLWKNKFLSTLNILGLSIGISCCLLMLLFIQDELSFDTYNKDAGRIYRVVKDFMNDDGSTLPDATTPPAIGPAMQREIPEVESMVRVFPNWGRRYLVKYGDRKFYEEGVYRVDSNFFDIFTIPFTRGNARSSFTKSKPVILTQSSQKKYFGDEDPIGKIIELDQMGNYEVTAVIKDVPANSHFKFDFLIPLRTVNGGNTGLDNNWGFYNFYTYIKLKQNTQIAAVEPKIKAVFKKHQPDNKNIFYTQPVTAIHLSSHLKWELEPNGDRTYIFIFGTVALFVIVIAGINYINLVTAKSSLRAKEIGVRKAVGAGKRSIIYQFLTESVLVALIATIVAFILAQAALPVFNNITQKQLAIFQASTSYILTGFVAFALLSGVLAGMYPAFYLSAFNPVFVLKGIRIQSKNSFTLRSVLVVVQFVISIVLITGTLIITSQLDYMRNKKLGFNKDQVVILNNTNDLPGHGEALLNGLQESSAIQKASGCDGMIGGLNWTTEMRAKGSRNGQLVNLLDVGYDFIDALGIEMKEGREFSAAYPADTLNAVILNEKAIKDLGIPSPVIGQQIVLSQTKDTTIYGTVIGVTKDFNFTSLRDEIKPFAFFLSPKYFSQVVVKINSRNIKANIDEIKKIWDKQVADRPFDYYFLDEGIDKLYKSEDNLRSLLSYFTGLAIIIACFGLFGLAAFAAEQRVKEIGIRKVLGASVPGIVTLLSKDFLKLVFIAAVIAFPVAGWMMSKWLRDYQYRTQMHWWIFGLAGIMAFVIALLTISFQAIKAASANPVKSLRTE